MFITDETANNRSQVTFYRCSVCISEHVSSEPIAESTSYEASDYFDSPGAEKKRFLMV
jgi:hypothetical protein